MPTIEKLLKPIAILAQIVSIASSSMGDCGPGPCGPREMRSGTGCLTCAAGFYMNLQGHNCSSCYKYTAISSKSANITTPGNETHDHIFGCEKGEYMAGPNADQQCTPCQDCGSDEVLTNCTETKDTTCRRPTTPASTTNTPASTTNTPASTTNTPASTTNTPASTTNTPASTTNTPASTTNTPASTTNPPDLHTSTLPIAAQNNTSEGGNSSSYNETTRFVTKLDPTEATSSGNDNLRISVGVSVSLLLIIFISFMVFRCKRNKTCSKYNLKLAERMDAKQQNRILTRYVPVSVCGVELVDSISLPVVPGSIRADGRLATDSVMGEFTVV